MTIKEKELLVEIMTNVDDIIKFLMPDQRRIYRKAIRRIYGNYHNILEGISDDIQGHSARPEDDIKKGGDLK